MHSRCEAKMWAIVPVFGALLLAVAAAHDLGALSGQALALLVLGVLAVEAALVARNG